MSKTVLAQVDGFTPLMDGVVADVGLITAAIFGKAWRFCQMSDGVCKAAQERIADELGLSRATVNAHFKILCDNGYLEDRTPDLLGVPHEYADTGKANLSISFTGKVTTCQKDLHLPVKQIDTKIVVKKDDNKENAPIETPIATAQPARFTELEISQNLALLTKLSQENLTGMITPIMREMLIECASTYPGHLYEEAFKAAVANNSRNWKYVSACIVNAAEGKEYVPAKKKAYTPKAEKPAAPTPQKPVVVDARGRIASY